MEKKLNGFKVEDLEVAYSVLDKFSFDCCNGSFDGWGIDPSDISRVKFYIENLIDGVYSNN